MIHKEGYPTLIYSLAVFAVLAAIPYYMAPFLFIPVVVVLACLYFFLLSFFRNPVRKIADFDDSKIYAPADGKIVVIEKTRETEYLKEERILVSIFMSPLNVHVNRNPVSADVEFSKYHPGKFLPAWDPKASTENERTTVVYTNNRGKILMRQIAGALAKRIVCYLNKGDKVTQGEDMGFIKLGSRVDLYLPLTSKVLVEKGAVVKGNLTVIAQM